MVTRQLLFALILCACFAFFLIALNSLLPVQASVFIFSESGPFEILSFILWFIFAMAVILFMRPRNWTTISLALLATVAGLRELGANKALTSESITRISSYLNADIIWLERLSVAGFIVFLGVPSTLLLVKFGRWLFQRNGLEHPVGQIVLLAFLLVPVTKILERLKAYLRFFWTSNHHYGWPGR